MYFLCFIVVYGVKREKSQSESSIWYHVAQKDQSESWKKICIKNSNNNPQKSPEILVFLPETPPNLSEPIRHLSRKLVVKFGEEKGNITAEARTRNLWRANPTRTPLDYRVSHTRQGKFAYLCCNRKGNRPKAFRNYRENTGKNEGLFVHLTSNRLFPRHFDLVDTDLKGSFRDIELAVVCSVSENRDIELADYCSVSENRTGLFLNTEELTLCQGLDGST